MGDREIKSLVEAAIALRLGLSSVKVATEVFDGRVFLVGEVDTLAQETEAILAAKSVAGVREVISSLRIAGIEPEKGPETDDIALRSRIERALLDHGFALPQGGVIVSRGEVVLHGQIDSPRRRTQAERLVSTIEGVRRVRNELQIAKRA